MSQNDAANGYEYTSGYEKLIRVPKKEVISISEKTKIIYGLSQDDYAFKDAADTVRTFSFLPNPELTTIQNFAFYNCIQLQSIDLSACSKLETIGECAFYNCNSAKTLSLPKNGALRTINNSAFYKLGALSLEIPNTVQDIHSAFASSSITTVTFEEPSSLTAIKFGAFSYTAIKTIQFPSSLATLDGGGLEYTILSSISLHPNNKNFKVDSNALYTINGETLAYCARYAKESFTVLENTKYITYGAFTGNIIKTIQFPTTLISITPYSFLECNVETLTFPKSLQIIGEGAFSACRHLRNITFLLPAAIQTIGSWAFSGCSELTTVYLPESITTISGAVFLNCPNVDIVFSQDSDFTFDKSSFLIMTKDKKKVTNYLGFKENDKITIPEETETISDSLFDNKPNIESVTFLGNNLKAISNFAFCLCTGIKSMEIPNSVEIIGVKAFYGSGLTELHFNIIKELSEMVFMDAVSLHTVTFVSVPLIPKLSFKNCISLSKITSGNGFIGIGSEAFRDCTKLENIAFTENLSNIDDYAFEGSALLELVIPSGAPISLISNFAFCNCQSLTSIDMPTTVTSFGVSAFSNTKIQHLTIPVGVKTIGRNCFYMCTSLEDFAIQPGSSLEEISNGAFSGCSSLRNIECTSNNFVLENYALFDSNRTKLIVFPPLSPIKVFCFPQTVREVRVGAFSCAKNLIVVTIPDNSIEIIGEYAFENCTSLKMINIPECVVALGTGAFKNCKNIGCGQAVYASKEIVSFLINEAEYPIIALKQCINRCTCGRSRISSFHYINLVFFQLALSTL